jgi:hypothetical protein
MRVIIAGGRNIHDYELVKAAIRESQFPISEIISGGAKGVDALGERYAEEMNIQLAIYYADWQKEGRAAGPLRNARMAKDGQALIAIWDGKSRGTKNMIETATKRGLKVYVKYVD